MTLAGSPAPQPRPILIAVCGNRLAGDDAFGQLVADRLRDACLDELGAELIDLGMRPAGLVPLLEARRGAILVDAAEPGPLAEAGILSLPFDDALRPLLRHDAALSSHGLSLVHELELARVLGVLPPRVWLVAAVGHQFALGAPPTADTPALADAAAAEVLALAGRWHRQPAEDSPGSEPTHGAAASETTAHGAAPATAPSSSARPAEVSPARSASHA